jgi:predicted glycoside hydrolase/deacetylase ChbG (UPF0249 family)
MTRPIQEFARAQGWPEDARVVVAHQDDVGMCHGANVAFKALAGKGFITCGSVMVPCPWFRELVAIVAADPAIDVGVHLTLTSEWDYYRWRPLTGSSKASGLVDAEGYFWRRIPMLRPHLVPEAVEAEFRAQIETALAAGLDVSPLDTHMGAALIPELRDIYTVLGRDYRLPVLFPASKENYFAGLNAGEIDPAGYAERARSLEAEGLPLVDDFRLTLPTERGASEPAYKEMIASLGEGLTFLALHCNAPGDIEVIVPPRAHWRINEYDLFRTPSFLAWLGTQDLRLAGMRQIRDWMRERQEKNGGS